MSHVCNQLKHNEKGSVAVEMAYAFPFLILVFMVMMFLMDLIMVKQEITTAGFSAMRTCASMPNKAACVLAVVEQNQSLPGSNNRYTCNANATQTSIAPGTTMQVVNLNCTYEGFTPIAQIMIMMGEDMSGMLNIDIPVFFPQI
jgi:Flp pilus assembly protein TadG